MAFGYDVTEATVTGGNSRGRFINRMKDEYLPAWDDHVHTGTKVAKRIAKKKGTMGGIRSLGSVMHAYPQSVGMSAFEGDDLPTPTSGAYFNPQIIARREYSRLRWTWEVRQSARGGKAAAWAEPKKEDMSTARKQMEINFERKMILGQGQVLATIASVNSNDYTLYGRDTRTSAANDRWKFGGHYLREGMSIEPVEVSGGNVRPLDGAFEESPSVRAERFVKSFDPSTGILQIAASQGGSATTFGGTLTADKTLLIPWGSRKVGTGTMDGTDAAGYDQHFAGPNGLLNLIVNGSYKTYVYGLSRTTYPTLSGRVFDGGGTLRSFDEDYITLAVDDISDNGTGDDPDVIFMDRSVRREYVKQTKGERRFEPVLKDKGFSKKLAFTAGDVPLTIETSRDVPPGLAFILDSDSFGWFSEAELQMVDEGERYVANKAAHEIVLAKSGNLACVKPYNNAIVEDISFSTSGLTV